MLLLITRMLAAALPVSVIARTFMAPFDCSGANGVNTMDADPSIRCDDGNPTHRRMVRCPCNTRRMFSPWSVLRHFALQRKH